MEHLTIDGHNFYNMIVNACNKLDEQKDFVNSLNVFPVPDGDTGTNMSMTFRNAVLEIENMKNEGIGSIAKKLSKGALMGARGNSGVILSQILRGIASGLDGLNKVDSEQFAKSIMEGSKFAYKAVMRPTEGTILTIIRSAGESAVNSKETDITRLMSEVCAASEKMLKKTPDMLPVLKKAKVVDSGGTGLLIILKGMQEALENNIEAVLEGVKKSSDVTKPKAEDISDAEIKFGYCTEFIIHSGTSSVSEFRDDISKLGDSMIVVNVDDITKVHIHTNDPGLVLSKAVKLGELSKIKIDNMREEHREVLGLKTEGSSSETTEEANEDQEKDFGFISVASGEGIAKIFKDLGVDFVIEGGQTMNPSTQDILSSINSINAKNIFVFPNNKNIIMAANQASELSDKNVVVIPTKTIPQGITCMTEFEYDGDVEKNKEKLTKAIEKVKTGSITYAVRDTDVDGKVVNANDILGIVEGKIKETGKDIYQVCEKIIDGMVDEDSELISIYYGKDCSEIKARELSKIIEDKYPDFDVQLTEGKQPLYYFIVSVE
ncbi:hypothetical protein BJV85_002263 [Clostridium acetobutylicum]|uniref:Predicted kinase related to hydroxyacetone kinase, YLOV ortholog n=1 Tax=Clostridium acetobutylicum (strain ATCC 824 / DSM 792 / JCM 1419 / IAM 19013 / LMG 5710 / NBRC 13948 / NRRL B-527 / VKM B-1787 / 2291 / W) TaxID=272562 RepID=Q97IB5_CLOAB|nr:MULTISPECIES: DAK2 domain-containing protein [Clostridium]AAK79701.1 Predicted kinase related to hydroxyacetone kinase, YLOV ortholog [Clostridium acetobutylicum ATCC 824]ADZ20785.1 Hydroxyacetone kinase [Clostridium acetobutylicum EA 2018]AEI33715.1 kinase, hydroxyacetone kinase [Clostridium acetobutylicum DSM 1731]AWV79864.1 DAK2 domain-containing protein [Clostridium acetobutylicum]MBC2394152.1 DAK2 domain-containing protein [Clostridium acetobutylicum]